MFSITIKIILLLMLLLPLLSLFPYTTLFRSYCSDQYRGSCRGFGEKAFRPPDLPAMRRGLPSGDQKREAGRGLRPVRRDRKSTRLNSSHVKISYAVFCLKKKR